MASTSTVIPEITTTEPQEHATQQTQQKQNKKNPKLQKEQNREVPLPKPTNNVDRLSRIQELTQLIVLAIDEAKSVSSENKKSVKDWAHDIESLARETMLSVVHGSLMAEVKSSIETTIKAELSKVTTVGTKTNESPTYAQVASPRPLTSTSNPTPPEKEKRISKPSIIIYPTSEDKNRQEVAEEWRRSVHFKQVNYAPAGVRHVGKNRLRVEFDTAVQRDETLQRMQPSASIRAEPSRQLKPMIILKGILKHTPLEELTNLIVSQNADIEALQPGAEELHLRFERRNRNAKLYNAVFITTPRVWKKIMELGRINIDHQRVHVEEFVPLMQCFKCLQFGHLKKYCTSDVDSCAHCEENSHTFATCPNKNNQEKANCFNCHNKNQRLKTNSDTKHSPTSDRCPIRAAMRDRVVGKINYGL